MTEATTEEPFNLAPAAAARLVGMKPETLADFAVKGILPSRRTPGGHRRYRRSDVLALLRDDTPAEAQS